MSQKLAVSLILLWETDAFLVNGNNPTQPSSSSVSMVMNESRRNWFFRLTAASPLSFLPQQAQAKDELFRSNPLTNSVFEQVRFSGSIEFRVLTSYCIPLIFAHLKSQTFHTLQWLFHFQFT
jgi:hypothetical protein